MNDSEDAQKGNVLTKRYRVTDGAGRVIFADNDYDEAWSVAEQQPGLADVQGWVYINGAYSWWIIETFFEGVPASLEEDD